MALFVRSLTDQEKKQLLAFVRTSTNNRICRRAQVILSSAQGVSVNDIAHLTTYCAEHVRCTIRAFNKYGIESIPTRYGGGRPPKFTPRQRSAIVELAEQPPHTVGLPLSHWSLSQLQKALISTKVVDYISQPHLRFILLEAGLTYQRTKTWKHSNDPRLDKKNG
jgi:transposase